MRNRYKSASAGEPTVRMSFAVALALCVATSLAPAQGADSGDEVLPAEFRWAQRKDRILLTIELQVRHANEPEMTFT